MEGWSKKNSVEVNSAISVNKEKLGLKTLKKEEDLTIYSTTLPNRTSFVAFCIASFMLIKLVTFTSG